MRARAFGAGLLAGVVISVLLTAVEAAIVPPLAHFLDAP